MKYTQNIEVEALQFTEDNIDEILDFICDGEPFEMCFVEDRETTKLDIIKKQKLYIEHPVGMITAYFGNYLVKISKNIFQVWSKEEFEKFHKIKLTDVKENKIKWAFSWNGENYYGGFDTREEAIEEARKTDKSAKSVFVGIEVPYKEKCKNIVEIVTDSLNAGAYEEMEELAEDYMLYFREGEKKILEDRLRETILIFQKEFGYEPSFFYVKEAEFVEL
ncbi:hypothetical protein FSBG_00174 [Fusobacterium gonidiaformans 3-1-5R]|uniref:Uncharacterized protein n=1 Tax=Fusobacterium gonidiaformans 3-1-5R TaxID=469605 RepID=E5BEZ6_9FUSO|nr:MULTISPECIES: hypothetical protein [Fusobacterium]EFS20677.1 hypothetical protein FSBG_00174 [Fusobacterium gonidiaformans 3-1-5R]KYM58560.1 hypothetical protein A2U09_07840 [Fusobacterium necrophorum subsp. funduliforme]